MATIYETIQELGTIVTDAITAGTSDNVPSRLIRTTLIKVSTGQYKEILPIEVPAECCILGDELRSTNVQPRTIYNSLDTLTPDGDFKYTYAALERLEDIVDDIVTGTTVTATTGNSQTQDQSWPYAETTTVAPAAQKLARNIRRRIDISLGNKLEGNLTPAYAMTTPASVFGYHRDLLSINKKFVVSEVTGYLNSNYPDLKYSRTKCKQDVGFILDALAYDLTYGGNWMTVKAGEAYYEGTNLNIDSSELAATKAAYDYLRDLVSVVGRGIAVAPVLNTDDETQVLNPGFSGNATTASFAVARLTDIINILNNGSGSVAITYPSTSGTDAELITVYNNLIANMDVIGEQTIDFIAKNFGTFKYDAAKCRRDLRKIIRDTSYDIAMGTNFNAVYTGLSYMRGNAYTVVTGQKTETIGAIRNARDELKISVTSDGSSAVGSSASSTRISTAYNEITNTINYGTPGSAEPGDGTVAALTFPNPSALPTANADDAKDNLVANRLFIQEEIIAWIAAQVAANTGNPASIWYEFTYNSAKCKRDVGFIVDALTYDVLYGGNQATVRVAESYFDDGTIQVYGQEAQTAAAYARLATVVSQIVQETSVTKSAGNAETQTTLGTPATSTEGNYVDGLVQVIEDVITAGNLDGLPATTYPDITWASAEFQGAFGDIAADREDVIRSTVQYITNTYTGFVYDHAKCTRDLTFIATAAGYDWMLGTNYASIMSAYSYLREPSAKIVGDQKNATIAANEFARQKAINYLNSNATAIAGLNDTWQWVEDTIFAGMPEGGVDAVADIEVYNGLRQLELNKEFIVDECVAYVDDYFKTIATGINTASNAIQIADTGWLSIGLPIKFQNGDDSANVVNEAGLQEDVPYYVREIVSATEFTISDSLYGPEEILNDYGEGFLINKVYDYNLELCKRDLREYIDGIKWDMTYPQLWKREYTDGVTIYLPGIYKSRLGARYYANSVLGCQEEDMFYLRNGTGLRMMTVDGLRGDLTPANAYGTSRVTAGAYASLDPGWGPGDKRVWITARSPYVQNCTTFGYAAIGQKIDGSLHNGGNDSIVSNDFTQVISDGIGAWITNNGRAELVSVFTYYSHIGYLAESGGRIRATNGNNSYGTFGSVAEGVDPDETPVTAIVDNKFQYNAVVSQVFTDQVDEILAVEYSHAGNEYTEAKLNFFGVGDSEDTLNDDFRDQAVNNIRILEVDDSTGNPDATAGGSGYLVVSNTAQTGDSTSITLAATDGNLSTAYPGMKVYVIAGAGAGYYGVIDTYNAGSKVATVVKESDGSAGWDHVIPGRAPSFPNASSTYFIEPRIEFAAPTKSNSNHTIASDGWNAVKYLETTKLYDNVSVTSQSDGIGATFDVTRNGSKYYITLNAAGAGYVRLDTLTISGADLDGVDSVNDITITVTAIDASTGAVVGFDFEGTGRRGVFVALPDGGSTANKSYDGQTWASATLATSANWQNLANGLIDDGSSTFLTSAAVAVGFTGGNTVVNYSVDGETWAAPDSQPSLTVSTTCDVEYGQIAADVGRMIVIGDNDRDVAYSDNGGVTWLTQANSLPSTGYVAVTYGAGRFVAVKNGSQEAAYSTDGITWTQTLVALPAASGWCDIEFGNNRFVAIADDTTNVAFSFDGVTWTSVASALVGTAGNRITYGQGMFVVTTDDTNQVSYSEYGTYWPAGGYTLSNTYTNGLFAVGFGNPDKEPKFVAVQGGTGATNVANAKIGATAKGRAGIANEKLFEVRLLDPGSGYGTTAPDITITDPNNIDDVLTEVRLGDGALAQPTYISRGSGFISATAEIDTANSNGFADFYQSGSFVAVRQLSAVPVNGSNIVFDSLPGQVFKLVNVVSRLGTIDGTYTAFLQTSPDMEIEDSPEHGDPVTLRIRFSQVRLTGHDFLDIGTGNFDDTNYPNEVYGPPVNDPNQENETVESNGGRVFYTATDQDGNFRVGDLFSIEQATGVATLNAEAFNIAGLQELTLGEVTLGGNSASVTEFSTDPFFTANSDSVVPTQRAIKAYIEAQIGGGQASLIVNSITAGDIYIAGTQITTVTGAPINIKANVNFQGTVLGLPIAYNYYFR